MALIRLQDIGKIYVSEGNVSVGIRGVNLSFESGEFVAVTGASGSGKSTLLNVISGMDTYEEGELYVDNQPTSHYVQQDWEEYRKKYISFIFQEYNIVDSFTVLQNVELALMHIKNIPERRRRALELIEKVGLSDHIHHKGSKLSGGQKQRTVIARALAKDSPIILADEPTGNLDSKSSEEIINLLREISENKLVIIVTHNFEEVEHCATRVIRVFDGAIESDRILTENISPVAPVPSPVPAETPEETTFFKTLAETLRNGIHLGYVRFLSKPRLAVFISLLMLISVLGSVLITSTFSDSLKYKKRANIFTHVDGRLIVTGKDGKSISDEALEELAKKVGATGTLHHDILLDTKVSLYSEDNFYYDFTPDSERFICRTSLNVKPTIGRFPEAANEILLSVPISDKGLYGTDLITKNAMTNLIKGITFKIVGIHYYIDNTKPRTVVFTPEGYNIATDASVFLSQKYDSQTSALANLFSNGDEENGDVINFAHSPHGSQEICISFSLPAQGFHIVKPVEPDIQAPAGNVSFSYENPFTESFVLSEVKLNSENYIESASFDNENITSGTLVLGTGIVSDLLDQYYKNTYLQASLFFENDRAAKAAIPKIRELGYFATMSNETKELPTADIILSLLGVILEVSLWFAVLCFIGLFLSMCSGKAMLANTDDIAIMRSMGISGKVIRISVYVQTLLAAVPAIVLSAVILTVLFTIPKTNGMFTFLHAGEYLLVLVGIIVICLYMSKRFVSKMFSSSVKKTLKGGLEK